METTTRPKAVSIELVVKEAFDRHAKGMSVEKQAEQIWQFLYDEVPNLDYNTIASKMREGSAKGNPDIIEALSRRLINAGFPDQGAFVGARKLAFPVFWVLSKTNALESQQTTNNKYLWSLDTGRYNAAQKKYDAAFEEYKSYFLHNLKTALEQKL